MTTANTRIQPAATAATDLRQPVENTARFLSLTHLPGERLFISTNLPDWRKEELRARGLTPEGWKDRPFDDVIAAATYALRMAETHHVYHGTSVFLPGATRRLAENVLCSRVARIDVDVKNGAYTSGEDSIGALIAFGRWFIPPSLTVGSSGFTGNAHAYWVFTEAVPADRLRMLYAKLAMATAKFGLITDSQCTVDLARVLRPLGTINHKQRDAPQPVVLLDKSGRPCTPDEFERALDAALARNTPTGAVPATLPVAMPAPPRTRSTTKFRRVGGMDPQAFCPQLSKSRAERGANDGYYTWLACLQFAKTHSDDPAEQLDLAVRLSDGYRLFSRKEVENKLKGLHSPPLCTKFDAARPGICPSCPKWTKAQHNPNASPITFYTWEVDHTAERKRLINDAVARLSNDYRDHIRRGGDAVAALRLFGLGFTALKARDPELARDCGFKLMAFLAKEWNDKIVSEMGTLAGLDDAIVQRWVRKLRTAQKDASLP